MSSNMGPPLSPREPRRSGRRSVPSSSSASKSTSPGPPDPTSAVSTHSTASSHGAAPASTKRKRDSNDDRETTPHPDNVVQGASGRGGKKGKRKGKKEVSVAVVEAEPVEPESNHATVEPGEDEGSTRCVCGRTGADEDEEDLFGFWIQCDTCHAWQHGRCVGFPSLQSAPANYFCEQCRPDLHPELMKKTKKKSASIPARSLSPTHSQHQTVILEKAPKRRNTMNSRYTVYADDLKKLIDEHSHDNESNMGDGDEEEGKKGKKSTSDSGTSERLLSTMYGPAALSTRDDRDGLSTVAGDEEDDVPIPMPTPSRGGRGGKRRKADADGKRQPNQYTYRRGGHAGGRGGHTQNASLHASTNGNSNGNYDSSTLTHHSYSHHKGQTPQPLLTTWHLPDYLAHLTPQLPTPAPTNILVPVPPPIASHPPPPDPKESNSGQGPSYTEERGVRVRWPVKRMSVTDMSKRVRGLMEWIGREQGGEGERSARKIALGFSASFSNSANSGRKSSEETKMEVDELPTVSSLSFGAIADSTCGKDMMEKMMEELILFQERYGGAAGVGS